MARARQPKPKPDVKIAGAYIASLKDKAGCPVNMLPAELLGKILTMVTRNQPTDVEQTCTVCLVCRHWRAVALDTPSAWSYIGIENIPAPDHLGSLRTRLERSKRAPLSVYVTEARFGGPRTVEYGCALVDVLAPHFDRCTTLTFRTGGELTMERVLEALRPLAAPLLTSLSLHLIPLQPCTWRQPVPVLQGGAPLLRFVELEAANIQWNHFITATSTIQALCLASNRDTYTLSARQLLSILASFTDLKVLSLTYLSPLYTDGGHELPSFSQLEELRIKDDNHAFMTRVIRSPEVSLRNLRRLHINSYDRIGEGSGVCTELLNALNLHFSSKASSNVRQLVFSHCHFDDALVAMFLVPHDRLQEIVFKSTNVSDIFLKFIALATGSGAPLVAPSLTRLDFQFCSAITGSSLLEVAKARTGNGRMAALQSIKVVACGRVSVDQIDEIKLLLQGTNDGIPS